jgi:plastocyanin
MNTQMHRYARQRRRTGFAVLAATCGFVLLGCADGGTDDSADGGSATTTVPPSTTEAPAEAPVTQIDVVAGGAAGEFAYTTDLTTVAAGRVQVDLTNEGALDHQAMLLRLDDGVDFPTLAAAGAESPAAFLDLVAGFGGPNGAAPAGGRSSSVQDLEPGNYLLACVIPDANGVPHLAQGMFLPFTVTDSDGAAPPAIGGDAEIRLVDFGFESDDDLELDAGSTVVVTNEGDQPHEIVAYPIDGDATIGEVTAALADPAAGPPPIGAEGAGLGIVRPGGRAAFVLPDRPGRYVLVCFIPDVAGDLQPHLVHGMVREVVLT